MAAVIALLLAGCTEANPGFALAAEGGAPALDGGPAGPDGEIIVLEGGVAPDLAPAPDSTPPCGAATCPQGCCMDDGSCAPGISNWACGTGGATCAVCGDGNACKQKQCTALPPLTQQVLLVSASLLGAAWPLCYEGSCDMYAEVAVGGQKVTSSIVNDNNAPVWNPPELLLEGTQSDLVGTVLEITLLDSDYGPDQTIGVCEVELYASVLGTGQHTLPCHYGNAATPTATVTLELAFAP